MSKRYQVLARKYRPQAFRNVVGQEAAVTTLKNAIRFDKIAHAYLFCGSRGVGKTTLARLFAKALNCHALNAELEPCNQCSSCKEIASGQSLDVIEIDGASNRGIDDIRQINETVGYAPSHGKFKIYIIDEVHMLTKEAFNALLKTLEEPPEQAKFFFATTEPHKVLPTIISRCQRFDLARIQLEPIAAKLQQIATDLSRTADPGALQLIAAFSEGSLRDAESLFDQILCFSDAAITASVVRQALGLVPQEIFTSLDQAFSNYDLSYAFELVDQLFQTGKDLAHFLEQMIEHYRNIVNAKCRPFDSHPSAKLYTQQQALHILDLLIQAESTFQKSSFQRISLESILLQIIRSRNRIPVEVLIRHLMDNAEKINLSTAAAGSTLKEEVLTAPAVPLETIRAAPPPLSNPIKEAESAPLQKEEKREAVFEPPFTQQVQPVKKEIVKLDEPVLSNPIKEPEAPCIAPPIQKEEEKTCSEPSHLAQKHPSHYDTLMRFAAVEFEGTVKI